jgi:cytochrome c oxidase cbb3-type subunit 3
MSDHNYNPEVDPETGEKLRDHEFDGIREYDNPMPAWWKRTFWATFWFAVLYIGYFHARAGRDVIDEYDADMQIFYEKQTQELLALGEVDEAMLATFLKNKGAMAEAKDTWNKTCVTCHKADGGGDIGPNLTDSHWLGKNTLMDIYVTIRDGRNKMPPWGKKLRPDVVMKMAAYVGAMRETHVAGGKAPEGNLLPPAPLPDTRAGAAKDAKPAGDAPAAPEPGK